MEKLHKAFLAISLRVVTMYSVEKIRSIGEFQLLKNVWNGLLNDKTRYRPYLEHEWFDLWLAYFIAECELAILLVKEGKEVKAICPFMVKNVRFKGVPVKKIELIGNVASPIRNFILADLSPSEKEQVLRCVFSFLNNINEWNVIELHSLPEENIDIAMISRLLSECGFQFKEFFCFSNWYLDGIDYSGEEYVGSRTSNIRKNIKRYRRKLQEIGDLRFQIITNGSDERIDHFMDWYYAVFKHSWKDWELHPTFHRDLAKLSRDKGWLRLGFLLLGDIPIATQLWLVCNGTAYILRLAYDEKYKKMIPGVILSAEMMKYVIDIDKVREVDYLIGDEQYKKDWTPQRRERRGILVFNNDSKGSLLSFLVRKAIPFSEKHEKLRRLKVTISKYLRIS